MEREFVMEFVKKQIRKECENPKLLKLCCGAALKAEEEGYTKQEGVDAAKECWLEMHKEKIAAKVRAAVALAEMNSNNLIQ